MISKFHGQMIKGPNGNLISIKDSYFQGTGYSLYLSSDTNVVVKIYEVNQITTKQYIQIEKQSYMLLKQHPYITSTRYGEVQQIPVILMKKGIILEKMFQKQIHGFNEPQILKIIRDLSKAISYCHSQGVMHRDIHSENIIYSDGKFKIQNFQKANFQVYSRIPNEIKTQIQQEIEMNIKISLRAQEQIDLNLGLPLNEKVDIFCIGCLLYYMLYNRYYDINTPNYTINFEWSVYGDKLYQLVKMLLAQNPIDRPSGNTIEQYIETYFSGDGSVQNSKIHPQIQIHAQSSNILNSSVNSSPVQIRSKSSNSSPKSNPMENKSLVKQPNPQKDIDEKLSVQEIEVKENKSSLYIQMIKYISRFSNKTEGWILACVEENEDGPKQKYVRFLIVKAWNKKDKITKFYVTLSQKIVKSAIDNTIIIVKSLILLHNYFKKGPQEVFMLFQKDKDSSAQEILRKIISHWRNVLDSLNSIKLGKSDNKDKYRSIYLSQLIFQYSNILNEKLRIGILYSNYFEGNFSLKPFFNSLVRQFKPITFSLIQSLQNYFQMCTSFSTLLFKENALVKIQFVLTLSIIDEMYCLLSLVSHLLFAFKHSTNYIEFEKQNSDLREKIANLEQSFTHTYSETVHFFNQCRHSQIFSSISTLIPQLSMNLLDLIKNVPVFQQTKGDFNIFDYLNYERNLDGIKLPYSFGEAVANIKIDNEEIINQSSNEERFNTINYPDKNLEQNLKQQSDSLNTIKKDINSPQQKNNLNDKILYQNTSNNIEQFNILNEFSHQTYSQDFNQVNQLNFREQNSKHEKNLKLFDFDQIQQLGQVNDSSDLEQAKLDINSLKDMGKRNPNVNQKSDLSQKKLAINLEIEPIKINDEETSLTNNLSLIKKKPPQEPKKFLKKQTLGYQDLSLSEDEIEDGNDSIELKPVQDIQNSNSRVTITKNMVDEDDFLAFPGPNQKTQQNPQARDFFADFSNFNQTLPRTQQFPNNPFANSQFGPISAPRREQTNNIFSQFPIHANRNSSPLNRSLIESSPKQVYKINSKFHEQNDQIHVQNQQKNSQQNSQQQNQRIFLNQQQRNNQQNNPQQVQQFNQIKQEQGLKVQQIQQTKAFELYNFITQELQTNANDWIINVDELTLENQVGTGSSCEVFQGYWGDNLVAIKKMKIKSLSENHMKEFRREITALVTIKPQKNLVSLIGISQKEDELYIVTEFCAGGTLFDLLHRKKTLNMPWLVRVRIGHQIASGMSYLHELQPPIIHRDLKSLNLLLENEYDEQNLQKVMIKIADFGLARVQDDEQMTGVLGTFHWMAPEIFESKPYSIKADVYSFGIVLWEVCSRETPYKSFTNPHAIMKYVTFDKGRPDLNLIQEGCPLQIKNLMIRCWDHEPVNRPGFSEILTILLSLI